MPNISFETFLQNYHAETHPEILDDDMPDAFDDWVSNLDSEDYIELAELWNKSNNQRLRGDA